MKKILLSNDDGYRAKGLKALREGLTGLADLTVVAPDRNKSGASNSLTLDAPLRLGKAEEGVFFVTGTPTDCVHMAISGLFEHEFDMVVSGINDGENLGDDSLYSGTIAAAVEGRFLGLPTLAFSLVRGEGTMHFATAAHVARCVVERLMSEPLSQSMILSVNVPNVPLDQLRGIVTTRLGHRHRSEKIIKAKDPRGRPIYWVGSAGPGQDAGPGTDFHAVAEGYASVTPLQVDLTRHAALDEVQHWLKGMRL